MNRLLARKGGLQWAGLVIGASLGAATVSENWKEGHGSAAKMESSTEATRAKKLAAAMKEDCAETVCDDKKQLFFGGGKKKAKQGQCPLNRSELGRATWSLLHTTAAYYPEKPSAEEKQAAAQLIDSLSLLYPCTHCREHFRAHVEKHPPTVENREELSVWLCNMHNIVNKVLDKPVFDCAKYQTRWRTGCRSAKDDESASESLGQDLN